MKMRRATQRLYERTSQHFESLTEDDDIRTWASLAEKRYRLGCRLDREQLRGRAMRFTRLRRFNRFQEAPSIELEAISYMNV